MELDRALEILQALNDEGVDYVLVGALALNLHGLPRATEDLDVFVRENAENIKRIRTAFRHLWDDPEIDNLRSEDLEGEYPVIRYGPPDEDFVIDLISRLGDAFRFDDLESETIVLKDVRVRVVTAATLYAMKKDTIRGQDRVDADLLKQKFELSDD